MSSKARFHAKVAHQRPRSAGSESNLPDLPAAPKVSDFQLAGTLLQRRGRHSELSEWRMMEGWMSGSTA